MDVAELSANVITALYLALLLFNPVVLVIYWRTRAMPWARRLGLRTAQVNGVVLLLTVLGMVIGYELVRGTEWEFAVLAAMFASSLLLGELLLLLAVLRWGPRPPPGP
jgi:hypothetical protein